MSRKVKLKVVARVLYLNKSVGSVVRLVQLRKVKEKLVTPVRSSRKPDGIDVIRVHPLNKSSQLVIPVIPLNVLKIAVVLAAASLVKKFIDVAEPLIVMVQVPAVAY